MIKDILMGAFAALSLLAQIAGYCLLYSVNWKAALGVFLIHFAININKRLDVNFFKK